MTGSLLSRRRFLEIGAGVAAGWLFAPRLVGAECSVRFADVTERFEATGISAYDLSTLRDVITPNDAFFIRNHFGAVLVREAQISVEGRLARPGVWTLEKLRDLPRRETVVTLECAGNSRAQGQGLVSTARWSGCRLADLLAAVGVRSEDDEIVFTGADTRSEGSEPYARSMKVREARSAGALLAWDMNGVPLPIDHGAPLRLIVPGWYGMASVKWLRKIEVRSEPFTGAFQKGWYVNRVRAADGGARMEPVTATLVKSVVATVEARGASLRLRGAAWGGVDPIARVDVTVDSGQSWHAATLEGQPQPGVWRLWHYDWKPRGEKPLIVASRAVDARGTSQPLVRPAELAEAPYARNEVLGRTLEVSC